MSIFQRETHKDLESILRRLRLNAENNYRDATLSDLEELATLFQDLDARGKLNSKQKAHYSSLIDHYRTQFKGFTHREQTANWN